MGMNILYIKTLSYEPTGIVNPKYLEYERIRDFSQLINHIMPIFERETKIGEEDGRQVKYNYYTLYTLKREDYKKILELTENETNEKLIQIRNILLDNPQLNKSSIKYTWE
jgi:hypothetical protein